MRRPASRLAPLVALALSGCVHERTKVVGTVPEGALAPPSARDRAPRESTWSERAFGRRRGPGTDASAPDGGGGARGWGETTGGARGEAVSFAPAPDLGGASGLAPERASGLAPGPSPAAARASGAGGAPPPPAIVRSAAPPAHRAIPAETSLADVAREKFLVSTTTVAAQRATLYVPAAWASEVSLTGAAVSDDAPGRRTAAGSGVATLRRLTVRAAQLTVVVRDGNPDLQVTARGDVSLHSDQPASVLDEEGLKSLYLKNDGYTPLR